MDEFKTSTKSSEWEGTFRAYETSEELLKATWNRARDRVAELVEKAHNKADNKTCNDEAALSYAIRLAYYVAQKYYTVIPEMDTGKGHTISSGCLDCTDRSGSGEYADIVCIPAPKYQEKPAFVIELKYNKDADEAIAQIKRQKYTDRLVHYKGHILLVGINYDRDATNNRPKFKHHSCLIEEA